MLSWPEGGWIQPTLVYDDNDKNNNDGMVTHISCFACLAWVKRVKNWPSHIGCVANGCSFDADRHPSFHWVGGVSCP